MEAGKLNKQIIIRTKTVTYDAYHSPIEAWADTATVWAGITTTGGGEFYSAQKINADTEALINIRYRALAKTQRINYGARVFEILHINDPKEAHEELLISVKEVV